MTSCVCLLYTCNATVQASASDDLLNHSTSALGNACRVWCTGSWFVYDGVYMCRHITYIATGILTQVQAAMWVKDIPHTSSRIAAYFSYGVVWELYS